LCWSRLWRARGQRALRLGVGEGVG